MIIENIHSLTTSEIWLVIGKSMLHIMWVGTVFWMMAAIGRWLLQGASPKIRYLYVVGCLFALPILMLMVAIAVYCIQSENLPKVAGSTIAEPNVLRLLPWVWLSGTLGYLAFTWAGVVGTQRLRRQCSVDVQGELSVLCDRLARSLKLSCRITVGVSNRIATPVLVGIVRPLILLPTAALSGWSPHQLEMVLLHELAHIRRWDNLVILIQRLIESLLFFHPAAWVMSGWILREREHCCDEFVISQTGRRHDYVETLIELAAVKKPLPEVATASSFSRHNVVDRIRFILNREDEIMPISRLALGVAVLALLAIGGLFVANIVSVSNASPRVVKVPSETRSTKIDKNKKKTNKETSIDSTIKEPLELDKVLTTRAAASAIITAKRNWGPEQVLGEPDTFQAGDIVTAWASNSQDGQREWLLMEYAEAIQPKMIVIHETYNPGAVDKVSVFDPDGNEVVVWEGDDPTSPDKDKGISVILVKTKFKVNKVKIYIDSPKVPGWNEIDAVGIRDVDNKIAWASKVEASSTYASSSIPPLVVTQAQMQRFLNLEKEVKQLKKEIERITKLEAEIESLKKILKNRER